MGFFNMISLPQKTLRWILIPTNAAFLLIVLICTTVPYSFIPNKSYTPFVFWLFKPALLIEIILSTTVLVMGFTGATKYNKCWQGSYSFFLLLLVVIACCVLATANDIMNSQKNVIKDLGSVGTYESYLLQIKDDFNCPLTDNCTGSAYLCWENTVDPSLGCYEIIKKDMHDVPDKVKPWIIASIVFLSIAVINILLFLFVSDADDSAAEKFDGD